MLYGHDQRYIPVHLVASELELPICCLLPAMHAISRCNSVSSFSHAGIITFQTLKNKHDKLTDEFPSLSLESLSVVTSVQYVCYFTMR